MKPTLKIDWATHEAAKFACENWHYSGCMPTNKTVKFGVWEDGAFIGVVVFSPGASANLYKAFERDFGISNIEACELTRVALKTHRAPVSKILALSIKILKKEFPGLRLLVSFADPGQGHHGGIYQATNWVYVGVPKSANQEFLIDGKWTHNRTAQARFGPKGFSDLKKDPLVQKRASSYKHKYLMPLDDDIRAKVEKFRKPYPKCAGSRAIAAPDFQSGEDGVNPIPALHSDK